MLHNPEEAAKRSCAVDPKRNCLGVGCMAWRWAEGQASPQFWRHTDAAAVDEPERPAFVDEDAEWVPYDCTVPGSRSGWIISRERERQGYCGRVGSPEFAN